MTKYILYRDGQIVGYSRSDGSASYDNQNWGTMVIPFDVKKQFLNFDQDNLVEIYEA